MAKEKRQTKLTPMEARRLAVVAETDPRTIIAVLDGAGTAKAEARARARRVLEAEGYLAPLGSGS